MAGPSDVGDSGQSGRRARKPQPAAPSGEPDAGRAEEELAAEEHGYAGRDVVPGDDGLVEGGRVVADQDRHGITHGERSRPGDRTHAGHAADDDEDLDEAINHRAARWRVRSRPWAGVGAFPQGYIETGATPPWRGGGVMPGVIPGVIPPL